MRHHINTRKNQSPSVRAAFLSKFRRSSRTGHVGIDPRANTPRIQAYGKEDQDRSGISKFFLGKFLERDTSSSWGVKWRRGKGQWDDLERIPSNISAVISFGLRVC
jgi:hypothetical protein